MIYISNVNITFQKTTEENTGRRKYFLLNYVNEYMGIRC